MQRINVGHKSLADYRSIIGATMADEIKTLAEPLRGRRMLHLSATAFGGGVAEIQYTLLAASERRWNRRGVAGDRRPG